MTALHTYSYIVVDTQRGCHTLKKNAHIILLKLPLYLEPFDAECYAYVTYGMISKIFTSYTTINIKIHTIKCYKFFFFWLHVSVALATIIRPTLTDRAPS